MKSDLPAHLECKRVNEGTFAVRVRGKMTNEVQHLRAASQNGLPGYVPIAILSCAIGRPIRRTETLIRISVTELKEDQHE